MKLLLFACVAAGAAEPAPGVGAVTAIVAAEPFVLDVPYRFDWSATHPEVTGGTLLVLQVPPEFLAVRDVGQPVLFVNDAPAEVLVRDVRAGQMVVAVPGVLGAEVYVYFHGDSLPETITPEQGAQALTQARSAGAHPFVAPRAAAPRQLADHAALAAAARR